MNLRDGAEDLNGHQDDYNNNNQAKIDKSENNYTNGHFFDEGDSISSVIKNGMKQPRSTKSSVIKISKVTPMNDKPSIKKLSDSEFSFDDEASEDFTLTLER